MSTLKVNSITNLNNEAQFGPVLMTAQASTSGTNIDFTGIPSWAKRITVMMSAVSTNGTNAVIVQLGDSGGVETSGYVGTGSRVSSGVTSASYTTGFGIYPEGGAASSRNGAMTISLLDASTNTWVASGNFSESTTNTYQCSGAKSLSATLDRIRITTVNGTDTFDAGTINVMYE